MSIAVTGRSVVDELKVGSENFGPCVFVLLEKTYRDTKQTTKDKGSRERYQKNHWMDSGV